MSKAKINNITCTDALSGLKKLKDNSIDIAFVDPPYNVGKNYGEGIDDSLPDKEFEQLMKDVISEFRRVTKRGFAFYLDWKQYQKFWNLIPDAEPIIIFKRSSGVVYSPLKIVQHHHVILTTAPAIKKQCKSLWDDIRVMGEGYFFREERFDHPAQTSLKATRRYIEYFTEEQLKIFSIVLFRFLLTYCVVCVPNVCFFIFVGFSLYLFLIFII